MGEAWEVPGYEVQAMLGFGATGEVWRAREVATGDVVALKRLREGADPVAVEALRREATLLRTLDTPYVVRLRAVVGDVLVLDHAPGGSLAALLARRGCLDPGEVVTVAVPLASALASAHAVGLVHGDVSPANVLFTAAGMPLLADLGVARVVGEHAGAVDGTAEYVDPAVAAGGEPGPASDVWSLAALCHHLLAGAPPHDGDSAAAVLDAAVAGERAPLGLLAPSAPRALVAAVEAGLAADPAQRPDAAAFCSLLRRAHASAPVRLTSGPAVHPVARETHVVRAAHAAPTVRRRWRSPVPPRRWVPVAGLVLLVLLAATVGWASGRNGVTRAAAVAPLPPSAAGVGRAPAQAAPSAGTASPPDWAGVLDGLDRHRCEAFAGADARALTGVWARGSPGLLADQRQVAALAREGRSAHGLRHELREVRAVTTGERTTLAVVDVLLDHEVRAADGVVVRRVAARGAVTWTVELVETAEGWRLASVVAA